jgi:alpha-glucosidase (family GH31 glycosyl hydrolase)
VYYDAPTFDKAYSEKGSYMFGSSLIVAPIVQPIALGQENLTQTTW